jgi:hypothetical protein
MNKLTLKDIFFGQTDAKNEFSNNSPAEKEAFIQSFLVPDNISLESIRSGKTFFITGLKGTGKTALMRYISLVLEKFEGYHSHFFLFKDEIGEDEKADFNKGSEWIRIEYGNPDDQGKDYETVWEWFILRKIVEVCEKKDIKLFKKDENWERFVTCVKKVSLDDKANNTLFPKLDSNNIVNKGAFPESINVNLKDSDIKENNDIIRMRFVDYIKHILSYYSELTPDEEKLYFFIDEVELSYGKRTQYLRDIFMIRDLIITIDRINRITREKNYGLYIITGIRSEVLNSTQSAGKEINKPIEDFGVNLMWEQSGKLSDHPLIKIIHKRLIAAEKSLDEKDRNNESEIWEKYFPKKIKDKPAQNYILYQTWFRPRDIVRLLNIAKRQDPHAEYFTTGIFGRIRKEYSTRSWNEHAEELKTTYTTDEIEGIKRILTGISCPFTYDEILEKAEAAKKNYSPVRKLLSGYNLSDVLIHLYNIGIIGNTGDAVRYAFRGDPDLLLEEKMKIHDALWSYLTISAKGFSYHKNKA